MSDNPNRFIKFWQELKRRKVFKVIAMYAGTAFIILEVVNNLALFLIEKDRNINEGMDLIEKALELNSDNYLYLVTKGWGLYKQGKFKGALEFLEKAWNSKLTYNHDVFLHLEAAKKAVADLQ